MKQISAHLETLRKGMEMQEDRAHIYTDLVQLQRMKIEAMTEEMRLLRRKRK